MKPQTAILMSMMLVLILVQGWSDQTRSDLKETGHDMKRDINDAAREIDNKVQDAVA